MKSPVRVLIGLILLPAVLLAQSITVEALKPQFEFERRKPLEPLEPTLLTTAWFVTLALPVTDHISVVGQLPFAFGRLDDVRDPIEDETLGNPALGLRLHYEHMTIDVAMRAPVAKQGFAGFVGSLADIERQEAFIPDIVPLTAMIRTKVNVSQFNIRPYGGVSFNLKTEDAGEEYNVLRRVFGARAEDGELYLLYGAEGWYEYQRLQVGVTFDARTWVTEDLTFSARSINQLSAQVKLALGRFVPGALFRFPLDDILLDFVVGLNCEYSF